MKGGRKTAEAMRPDQKIGDLEAIYRRHERAVAPFVREAVCRPGCGFCCTHYGRLDVTTVEGVAIRRRLDRIGGRTQKRLAERVGKNRREKEAGKAAVCPFLDVRQHCHQPAGRPAGKRSGEVMIDPLLEKAILERIEAIPIVDTLDMKIDSLSAGACEMTVPRRISYDGVYESFHGGLMMTAADSAACFAIFTLAGADAQLTTTDMGIRFLAPCRSDLTVRAQVVKFGRTLCPVSVDLFDADDVRVAVAQVCYIRVDSLGS